MFMDVIFLKGWFEVIICLRVFKNYFKLIRYISLKINCLGFFKCFILMNKRRNCMEIILIWIIVYGILMLNEEY